jgi:DhnA family fructose-bisphosphate aldolase class Ia
MSNGRRTGSRHHQGAHPGDAWIFEQWRIELGVPVVILGGPVGGNAQDLSQMVSDTMVAGARGITIGRMLWQRPIEEATELLMELRNIVHPHEAGSIDEIDAIGD